MPRIVRPKKTTEPMTLTTPIQGMWLKAPSTGAPRRPFQVSTPPRIMVRTLRTEGK